jgi:hypothetical protein
MATFLKEYGRTAIVSSLKQSTAINIDDFPPSISALAINEHMKLFKTR